MHTLGDLERNLRPPSRKKPGILLRRTEEKGTAFSRTNKNTALLQGAVF